MGEWHHPEHYSEQAKGFARAMRVAEIDVFVQAALPTLIGAARHHGYALARHGSEARDLDLIAIPWTESASDADSLIEALCEATRQATGWGHWSHRGHRGEREQKPHGRVAVMILATAEVHIDLSVMPRVPAGLDAVIPDHLR
ncbi:MAG TPA: hypothetical protein VKQ27_17785 [Acetobacteraceae bacterium]|nr:hypothetical protein [Acetobacteraceae bacterium]